MTEGSFAEKVIRFYFELDIPRVPPGTEVLDPYKNKEVKQVVTTYYKTFYQGNHKRIFLFGINPGRFGGGVTGLPFTDPVRLKDTGIDHNFPLKPELSSVYIYEMMEAFGGIQKFADSFFLTALSPVGFTSQGKNLNYYDHKQLEIMVRPFIIETMEKQINLGAVREIAFCLGEGTNAAYFRKLNDEFKWFDEIRSLPHPRWILQYRRKEKDLFINRYVSALNEACAILK